MRLTARALSKQDPHALHEALRLAERRARRSPKWDGSVPVDPLGNQLHYPDGAYVSGVWMPSGMVKCAPFIGRLTYVSYERGRSAAYFVFRRESTQTTVTMFMKDLDEVIPHMCEGAVTGNWRYVKRGQNYGVALVDVAKEQSK